MVSLSWSSATYMWAPALLDSLYGVPDSFVSQANLHQLLVLQQAALIEMVI
jgi:hypothetical protein